MSQHSFKGLIFDFDGLILETEGPEFQAWQEIYRKYGQELPLETWVLCVGASYDVFDPLDDLENLLGHPVDRISIKQEQQNRSIEIISTQKALPGVMDYLNDAKAMGLSLGVASSSSKEWVEGHLENLGIKSYFDSIKTSNDVLNVKPCPDLYQESLLALGLEPSQAIAFEDSRNGVMAAKRAGITCIAIPNDITRHSDFSHADLRIQSLDSLALHELLVRLQN